TPRKDCGDGEVLSESTVVYNGNEIHFVQMTCPNYLNVTAPTVQKRQVAQCSDGGCSTTCENLGPYISDCQAITYYLEGKSPQTFISPPGTYTAWSAYTCEYAFLNYDSVSYSVCYINLGYNAIISAEGCFGDYPAPSATAGAYCQSLGIPGNDWDIL
ncbi:hypothetical protein BV25DRAFT_1799122, partial [Artomyces pyxidatus]